MNRMPTLRCRVTQGAFSGEVFFWIPLRTGAEYQSLGPIQDFQDLDHAPLHHPIAPDSTALMSVLLVNDELALLPDGEAIRLDRLAQQPVLL